MSKIKNIVIMVCVLTILSIIVYSIDKSSKEQLTTDISLEKIEECKTVYWDEEQSIYSTCTDNYLETVCDDPPLNTSCSSVEKSYSYQCRNGTKTVTKSKEVCNDKEFKVTVGTQTKKDYLLEYGEWGKCSYDTINDELIIVCDSKYDGNNDGKCKSGESCIQFKVTKDSVTRLVKNSQEQFTETDESFFLEKLSLNEVGK